MKCVSFNVNSVRTRMHQLREVVEKYQPEFIGLQETKVTDEEFPLSEIEALGYHVEFFGQKTHYGVALLSKLPFSSVIKGFPNDAEDAQRRLIGGTFALPSSETLTVINGYFPQGESRDHPTKFPNKEAFYENLNLLIDSEKLNQKNTIIMGDMNISYRDSDISIGDDNRKRWLKTGKCSFLPEEREWLGKLYDKGFTDTYRSHVADKDTLQSWFDYRSRGFEREPKRGLRIDLILASPSLIQTCTAVGVDQDIRAMERPSDHCPVWAEFDISI